MLPPWAIFEFIKFDNNLNDKLRFIFQKSFGHDFCYKQYIKNVD